METETIKAISDAFAPIAEKIGQEAQFGWEMVVRQQYVEGFSYLIWSPFLLIIGGICWYVSFKYSEKTYGTSLWAILPAIIFTVWGVSNIDAGILHLLNPNYYALDFFINIAKPTN